MTDARRRDLSLALLWKLTPREVRRLRAERRVGAASAGSLPGHTGGPLPLPPGELERMEALLDRHGITFLTEEDPSYPAGLKAVHDPPPFLFLRGAPFPLPGAEAPPRVGLVGSRRASASGREIAFGLARDLSLSGCEIVSGMARGIDAEAHRGALSAGGRTLAVLGTGPDLCYPPEHAALMAEILLHGGVVSEFPPGTPPLRFHFPRRNRILAALCDVLVVVEGGERSGALSTVEHALDLGIEVMTVPRDIVLPGSRLPNRLLRDGARPVLAVGDVLDELEARKDRMSAMRRGTRSGTRAGAMSAKRTAVPAGADGEGPGAEPTGAGGERPAGDCLRSRIRALLRAGAQDLDAILRHCAPHGPGEIQAGLLRLELEGRIVRLPGGRFENAR